MQEENGRKSSTREFLSFVPTACFKATTMKVADIFFNLWKKEKKPNLKRVLKAFFKFEKCWLIVYFIIVL